MRRRRYRLNEIDPDEILLDSSNLPSFDPYQLEGRFERPISNRTYAGLALAIGLIFFGLLLQAWNLEVVHGTEYAKQSARNQLKQDTLFAERGLITDVNGIPLAINVPGDEFFTKRSYRTSGFGNLLGYVSYPRRDSSGNFYDTTETGLAGIEAYFNEMLSGKNGLVLTEEDALGHPVSQGTVKKPIDGTMLRLSIDVRAQEAFFHAIGTLADRVSFLGGAAVLMDIHTGEVRALVSYPEYDPNVMSGGSPAEIIASYQNNSRRPFLDRPVAGLYAPGSIVKPLVASGALTDGVITPQTTIVSTGSIVVPNPYYPDKPSVFKDWKALGSLDLVHAIAFSSDVYFYTVGGGFGNQKGLGIDRLGYWYRTFGLGSVTGIELSGEASGFIPTPAWKEETYGDPWRIGDTYFTAIGQYAMQVTPLQMVRAIAAIGNGGSLVTPTLVASTTLSGKSIAVSGNALKVVREGMRIGAIEGTAVGLNVPFVHIAAKTGTAQVGVHNEYSNSWVTGFFPYENPKYAFIVVMERGPAKNLIGGVFAAREALTELNSTAPEYFKP